MIGPKNSLYASRVEEKSKQGLNWGKWVHDGLDRVTAAVHNQPDNGRCEHQILPVDHYRVEKETSRMTCLKHHVVGSCTIFHLRFYPWAFDEVNVSDLSP